MQDFGLCLLEYLRVVKYASIYVSLDPDPNQYIPMEEVDIHLGSEYSYAPALRKYDGDTLYPSYCLSSRNTSSE